jgi:ADP-heptose:LPS heptosyltransferase
MRIVALVPGGLEEQLLFFPTLDALKQAYPNSTLDVVVEPRAQSAYRVSKAVSSTIPYDYQARNSPADWANLLGVLRDRTYDVAISLSKGWGAELLLWLTGIPVRIGYGKSGYLTNTVSIKTDQYEALQNYDLLQGLGISAPCPELAITLPIKDIEWAEAEQKRLGLPGGGYVMIYSGDPDAGRYYPAEHWQKIIADFQQRQPELPIVVVDGTGDREFIRSMLQACPTLKVTQPGDLGKLAAIIAGANLMLCPDSLAMQLAVALKVFTLALFGETNPETRLPQGDRFVGIKSPTGNLADIAPETVLAKVWGG